MSSFPILDHAEVPAALSEPGLVLLDFWQQSCAPCRALEPRLEQLTQRRSGEFTGYRIDVDTNQTTPTDFGVQSIPTLILLRDGHEVARLDGLIRDADLDRVLDEHGTSPGR
ncbi:thioredoxin family protein [Pseudonocardia nigra]|uniref:thioredoxin family protein n=1 Tax=Pseudonocardia nigra TaxID=1921578 RepID=UPI001C5E006A|nr:thioredoxin domain-containing protein [Pseudonocardia nigra]